MHRIYTPSTFLHACMIIPLMVQKDFMGKGVLLVPDTGSQILNNTGPFCVPVL